MKIIDTYMRNKYKKAMKRMQELKKELAVSRWEETKTYSTDLRNIEYECTSCGSTWVTSPGCVGDCLHCGARIISPSENTMKEVLIERKRQQIKRIK